MKIPKRIKPLVEEGRVGEVVRQLTSGKAARIREKLAATEQREVLPPEEETAEAQPDAK